MRLIENIKQLPRLVDPAQGQVVVDQWNATGTLADLLRGVAGTSPFLRSQLTKHVDWLSEAVRHDAPIYALLESLPDAADVPTALRQAKGRIAAYLALAELSGAHDVMEGTARLTRFADLSVDMALRHEIARQGQLPADMPWFVLAMGKMGAFELNYSSDIDIIVFVDDSALSRAEAQQVRAQMVKVVRRAHKLLSDMQPDGYVFRTDLRLRPDPSVTPVAVLTSQALAYYESLGRTWERAAFIKARVCAGDMQAGAAFLAQLSPFIWRKYLDFAAIEEAHDLRLKIWEQGQWSKAISVPGHDVKLGRGGIRDIEFFTQTRQLIAGGRDRDLRLTGTLPALSALATAGWVTREAADELQTHYKALRRIEHAIQMMRDAQTHQLPSDEGGLDAIAALLGQSVEAFVLQTDRRLRAVHGIANQFFEPPATADTKIDIDTSITERWPGYAALRSPRSAALFEQIEPKLMQGLSQAADPQQALLQFDAFLSALPAGVQVFSLFAANPKIVELFTDIIATSPALAQYLGRNANVLDAILSGQFFAPWPGVAGLEELLERHLDQYDGYEAQLDGLRVFRLEWSFQIGVHLIKSIIAPSDATRHYSDLSDAIMRVLVRVVQTEFERKHGHVPGASWMVLGMGSLGARSLSAGSDLDLMVIFDADPNAHSDGPRGLNARPYFGRLTQALITGLSAQMPHGVLYEVDMRLRPSGKAGPIATRFESFENYQRNEAWTWEHLALTRARPIAGDQALMGRVDALRQNIVSAQAGRPEVMVDVQDMRRRLAAEKPQAGPWDMKNGPGGLMDIELFAQARTLLAGRAARRVSQQLGPGPLLEIYEQLAALKTLHAVLCQHGTRVFEPGAGAWNVIADHCQIQDMPQLEQQMSRLRALAVSLIDKGLHDH